MRSPREIKEEEIPVTISDGPQDGNLYPDLINEEGEYERDKKSGHQMGSHSDPCTGSETGKPSVLSKPHPEEETNVRSHVEIGKGPLDVRPPVVIKVEQKELNIRDQVKAEENPGSTREGPQDGNLYPDLINEEGEYERDKKSGHQMGSHSDPCTGPPDYNLHIERVKEEREEDGNIIQQIVIRSNPCEAGSMRQNPSGHHHNTGTYTEKCKTENSRELRKKIIFVQYKNNGLKSQRLPQETSQKRKEKCSECGDHFFTKSSLVIHQKIHAAENVKFRKST
ncbi:uncharacterized protein O3C94_023189 [Discoglossus pictus]